MGYVSIVFPSIPYRLSISIKCMFPQMFPYIIKMCPSGQEYQPGGVGIYLVVEYFERFWGVN